ncbi:MAG: ferritin [candidate division Zixibacteria bacterium]|nr:ferritin [candidate division Zixibacteria bacterium]
MITKKMQDAFNAQVGAEFYSAFLYLSMAAYLEDIDLPGAANWMRIQYQEEKSHAEKIFEYVIERDGRAEIPAWEAPKKAWKDAMDVFESAYAHEQKVTALIGGLVKTARAEDDHASEIFLQWFVNEQVEEEASVKAIIQQLKMVDTSRGGLYMIDRELASRTFTPPATA